MKMVQLELQAALRATYVAHALLFMVSCKNHFVPAQDGQSSETCDLDNLFMPGIRKMVSHSRVILPTNNSPSMIKHGTFEALAAHALRIQQP